MKKALKIIGVLGVIIIILIFAFNIYLNWGSYYPSIVNFTPKNFEYKAGSPIYYSQKGLIKSDLFYSESGKLSDGRKIWSGKLGVYQFVSPNAKYIAFSTDDKLVVIKNDGTIVSEFRPFRSEFDKMKKGEMFYKDVLQWSPDSNFFLLYKAVHLDVFPWEIKEKGMLVKYDIATKSEQDLINGFYAGNYFLSNDMENVYYESYDKNGDGVILESNIESKNQEIVSEGEKCTEDQNGKESSNEPINYLSDNIFVNFDKSQFGDSLSYISYDDKKSIFIKDGVNLYENGQKIKLIEIKDGYSSFEGRMYNINLNRSAYFLPGNRYFIFNDKTKENNKSIVIDTTENKYTVMNEKLEAYFPLNSQNSTKVEVKCGDIREKIDLTKRY